MQTINELLLDAVEYNEYSLAYSLFIAAQKKIIKLSDPVEKIDYDKFPHDHIQLALANDALNLKANSIKLFLVKRLENDYAVYFARNEKEVQDLHYKVFNYIPTNLIDRSTMIDSSIWDDNRKKYISFRQLKKLTQVFPSFLFLMEGKKKY